MPTFEYSAVDASGARSTAQIEADSQQTAVERVQASGRFVVSIALASGSAAPEPAARIGFFARAKQPKPTEVTQFLRELALLLSAGLSVEAALALIEKDDAAPALQPLAQRMRAKVVGGRALSEACAAEPSIPEDATAMIRAAEATGAIAPSIERLAAAREAAEARNSEVSTALRGPFITLAAAVLVSIGLLVYLVPVLKTLVTGANSGSLLKGMIWLSDAITSHGRWLIVGVLALLVACAIGVRQRAVRSALERLGAKLPVVGPLMRNAVTARFCRTLGLLLRNGVRLEHALPLTRSVVANARAVTLIDRATDATRSGRPFADEFAGSDVFPPVVASLFRMGAETSALAETSERLAAMYEKKQEASLARLTALLQPAATLLVAALVAALVMSVVSSILAIYEQVNF